MTKKELYRYEKQTSAGKTKYQGGFGIRIRGVKFTFIVYLVRMEVKDITVRFKYHYLLRWALATDGKHQYSGIAKTWFK